MSKEIQDNKTKKLSLSQAKSINKKYNKKEKVKINDEYHVNIYPNLSPTKLQKLIQETISDSYDAKERGIEFKEIDSSIWSFFNLVKHFSDLSIPDDIEEKIQAYITLVDAEVLMPIVNAFPSESLKILANSFKRMTENISIVHNMSDEEKEEFFKQFQNDAKVDLEDDAFISENSRGKGIVQ